MNPKIASLPSPPQTQAVQDVARAGAPSRSTVLREWARVRSLVAGRRRATYVSTPITSGKRWVDWWITDGRMLQGAEYTRSLRSDVMLPNLQRAGRIVESLRTQLEGVVIDPNVLDVEGWEQDDYLQFWVEVLRLYVARVVLLDGWQYSKGCTIEFSHAIELGIETVDERLRPLSSEDALTLIGDAIQETEQLGVRLYGPAAILAKLRGTPPTRQLFKDETLDQLATTANVAHFVSFAPFTLQQRFARLAGYPANHHFATPREAIAALFAISRNGQVNVRSFRPEAPEGNPFRMGLTRVDDVLDLLTQWGQDKGLHTIVNEMIDTNDGGVSGVAYRGLLEFAPGATPRVVDDETVERCQLPLALGRDVLRTVYGASLPIDEFVGARVELSVHPGRRGWAHEQWIAWQLERRPMAPISRAIRWPHRFSRLIGDKTFGLLLAHHSGFLVPRSTVYLAQSRLFPFQFGSATGTSEIWTRPAPTEKYPGYYPTVRGWVDPTAFFNVWPAYLTNRRTETPSHPMAAVLVQEGVGAQYSGRAGTRDGQLSVAGVHGYGDAFMQGDEAAGTLPPRVLQAVVELYMQLTLVFGEVEIEWVYDGVETWIVQLGPSIDRKPPPAPRGWIRFNYRRGALEEFRSRVVEASRQGVGIVVIGNVDALSHAGEIADLAGVPVVWERQSPA